jgi:chromosome segregation ATPase
MSHSPVEVVVHPVFSEDELTRLRRENAALRDRMESSELEQDDWYEGMERWVHVADDLLEHCDFLDRKIRALKKQRGALHQTVAALQARAQVLEHEKAAEAAQRSLAAAAAAAAASQVRQPTLLFY